MTSWKSPVYNPDTRKNPNSPVAHQPNVSYDHRSPSQPQGQPAFQGYHHYRPPTAAQQQQFQYHPYVPPQAQSTPNWRTPPTTSGPILNGTDQYAHSLQSKAPASNPSAAQPTSGSLPQLPPYPWSQGAGQNLNQSPYRPVGPAPSGRASISNILSNPTGTPKPTKYADAPSSIVYTAKSSTEYLKYLLDFPYLKNAYLRRAKTYVSPYSPGGGFSESWMPKLPNSGTPTSVAPSPGGPTPPQAHYHGQQQIPSLPAPKPAAQFQSSDAFQRDMARTNQPTDGVPKWEQMLKQLATSTGAPSGPTTTAGPSQAPRPYYTPPQRSSMSYEMPKSMQPAPAYTPPQLPPCEPQRPTPSPISDDGKEADAKPQLQGKPPPAPLQPAPTLHGGETWRYT